MLDLNLNRFLFNLGWSYYSVEDNLTMCSVEWKEQSTNVVSYNSAMFLFLYFIPLTVICVTSRKIINVVNVFTIFFFTYFIKLTTKRDRKFLKI